MHQSVLVSLVRAFGCVSLQLHSVTELCIVILPYPDLQRLDILDSTLPLMDCPQRIITVRYAELGFRSCTLFLMPLTGNDMFGMARILQRVTREKTVRFSSFIFFGFKGQQKFHFNMNFNHDGYRSLLMQYKLTKSVFVELIDGKEHVHQFNFITNRYEQADGKSIAELLEIDIVRNVRGYAMRSEKRERVSILYAPFLKLITTFAAYVNASLQWTEAPTQKPRFQWHIQQEIDLAVKQIVLENASDYDIIPDHYFDGLCLVIPEEAVKPYVYYLHTPFSTDLWILIALFVSFYYSLKRFPTHGRKARLLVKFMLSSATWAEFILCEAYFVKLISFMLGIKHKPHLQSMEEFNRSGLKIFVMNVAELQKKARIYFSEDRWESKNAERITHILGCDVAQVIVAMAWNWDPVRGMRKYYLMDERIHWFLSTTIFTPKSPMFQKYKLVSDWVFESGLWNFWESRYKFKVGRAPNRKCDTLVFDDLISMWWLLFACGVAGVLVLLIECGMFHISRMIDECRRRIRIRQDE